MSPYRRALVLEMGTHPFEIGTLAVLIAIGLAGFLPSSQSKAVADAFPGKLEYLWYGAVVAASGLTLAGCLLGLRVDRRLTSLQLERVGLVGLPLLCPSYLSATLGSNGLGTLIPGLSFGGIGLFALWRICNINRDLRKVRDAIRDPQPADPPPLGEPNGDR